MRRYDEPVQVQRGRVGGVEAPEHFVWRERMWRVTSVAAQWAETGSWWEHPQLHALLGVGEDADAGGPAPSLASVVGEQEIWRVEATRGREGAAGVFDLAFDWSTGQWCLRSCLD